MIRVFTDTGADMTDELIEEGIKIIPLYITFDGINYLKQMEEIKVEEFYERLKAPREIYPRTSLASIQDYVDAFKEELKAGNDVLYICINSRFSSTIGSANNAKNILEEEFPDRKIIVVDSETVTYGQHYLALQAHKMAQKGASLDEILEILEKIKKTAKYYFTVDSLEYLKEGGRIGKASALLGGMLNIKPILLLEDGVISPVSKVRGRNKSLEAVIDLFAENIKDLDLSKYQITVLNADAVDEAKELKKEVEERFEINDINECVLGLSIGLHAGPGTVGIGLIEKT